MTELLPLLAGAHVLAATVWVGGMFFAYVVLRPSLGFAEGPVRLKTWDGCFRRFFAWVWAAVVLLPASGYPQVFGIYGGFAEAGPHVQIMHVVGLIMIFLFVFLYLVPFRAYARATAAEDWPAAAGQLPKIRRIVGINLILGLVTVAVGAAGRFWPW